jgi:hypothetical protein
MEKYSIIVLLSMIICTSVPAQTPGELTVSVNTSEAGGNYAPRNIVAIWVEDVSGNFLKTLLAYAQNRRTHLNTWQATTAEAGTEFNTVDAITGPTRNSHGSRVCRWDGTDFNGQLLPDGTYYLWMELTDKNATGNFSAFEFTKSDILDLRTPDDQPSFGSITITWEPQDPTAIFDAELNNPFLAYPNPGSGVFQLMTEEKCEVFLHDLNGKLVYKGNSSQFDVSHQPDGIYLLTVRSGHNSFHTRLIKR